MYAMSLRGNATDATRGYDPDYQHYQDEYWARRLRPAVKVRRISPKHASRRHTERAEGFDLAEG